MKIEWEPTINFTPGRKGKKIIAIVNHITAGLMPGTLSWLKNVKSQASAHYIVTKSGRIIQLVKDEDTAWHSGAVNKPIWKLYDGGNPNYYTIGIEHEGMPGDIPTHDQWKATVWLQRKLTNKWNIPLDSQYIIGHNMIDSVNRPNCPGSMINFQKLIYEIGRDAEVELSDWERNIMNWAMDKGILKSEHDPHEAPNLVTVLAIVKNAMEVKK